MSSKRKNTPIKIASTESHMMDVLLNKDAAQSPGAASDCSDAPNDNDCELPQTANGMVASPASSEGSLHGSESPGSDKTPRSKKQRILQSVMRRSPSPADNNNLKKGDDEEDMLRMHLNQQDALMPDDVSLASIEAALSAPGSNKDKQARLNAMIRQLQSIKESLSQVRTTSFWS
jgi:hypothetical protein